eukprot:1159767-Pelagomonas_calceolata.AAC.3
MIVEHSCSTLQYVKPRLRPGRHIYIDEEIQRTQDAYAEEQLRQKLKGEHNKLSAASSCAPCPRRQAKGFEVQEVAAAISSAVRAVLQEEVRKLDRWLLSHVEGMESVR